MVVQTLDRNSRRAGRMGLHVGRSNVVEHFPFRIDSVELELDHLCIVCTLEPSFWDDQPEIHDARLSIWLEAKRLGGKIPAAPALMALIPTGQHAFRLQLIPKDTAEPVLHVAPSNSTILVPVSLPTPIIGTAPVIAFDRRKRSIGHQPERRRVGKLKGNDSPASAASH